MYRKLYGTADARHGFCAAVKPSSDPALLYFVILDFHAQFTVVSTKALKAYVRVMV